VTVGFEKSDDAADHAEATIFAYNTGSIPRTDQVLFREGKVVIFREKIPRTPKSNNSVTVSEAHTGFEPRQRATVPRRTVILG